MWLEPRPSVSSPSPWRWSALSYPQQCLQEPTVQPVSFGRIVGHKGHSSDSESGHRSPVSPTEWHSPSPTCLARNIRIYWFQPWCLYKNICEGNKFFLQHQIICLVFQFFVITLLRGFVISRFRYHVITLSRYYVITLSRHYDITTTSIRGQTKKRMLAHPLHCL